MFVEKFTWPQKEQKFCCVELERSPSDLLQSLDSVAFHGGSRAKQESKKHLSVFRVFLKFLSGDAEAAEITGWHFSAVACESGKSSEDNSLSVVISKGWNRIFDTFDSFLLPQIWCWRKISTGGDICKHTHTHTHTNTHTPSRVRPRWFGKERSQVKRHWTLMGCKRSGNSWRRTLALSWRKSFIRERQTHGETQRKTNALLAGEIVNEKKNKTWHFQNNIASKFASNERISDMWAILIHAIATILWTVEVVCFTRQEDSSSGRGFWVSDASAGPFADGEAACDGEGGQLAVIEDLAMWDYISDDALFT